MPFKIFNSTTSDVFGGELQSSYQSKLGTTGVGLSYQKTNFRSLKLDTTNRSLTAVFVEHRFTFLNDRLDVTPGFMYSNYSDFGGGFFPGIDLGFKATENLKAYATWGKTYRIPTYTDLFFNNASNANNPNLIPEKAQNYEVGVKFNQNGWRSSAAWFLRNGVDVIDRTKNDASQAKWEPTNLANLNVSGIDFSIDYNPLVIKGADYWLERINLSATYLAKVDYIRPAEVKLSRYAADQLKWQANFGIQTKIVGKLSHSFNLRYFERLTLPAGYEEYYKGVLADWRLVWTAQNFKLYAQANNIFNKKYVESNGITMPRRWMSVGIETSFGKY